MRGSSSQRFVVDVFGGIWREVCSDRKCQIFGMALKNSKYKDQGFWEPELPGQIHKNSTSDARSRSR
jgi:hypothetical protein